MNRLDENFLVIVNNGDTKAICMVFYNQMIGSLIKTRQSAEKEKKEDFYGPSMALMILRMF